MKKYFIFCLILIILCACGKTDAPLPDAVESETAEEIAASPTIAPEDPEEVVVLDMPGFESPVEDDTTVPASIIENMAAPPTVEGIGVTDEMLKVSVMREGNTERIKDVMRRAAKGETITLGYIGGSITAGSNADPMITNCYAYLTTLWWQKTFPDAEFNYVNAGIGATDSYIGVHRADDDLLSFKPDLITVEFSVNDSTEINRETYDSLLLHLLKQDNAPAVVPLIICSDSHCFVETHFPIIESYDLPAISYYSLVFGGYVPWDKVGDPDMIHPLNPGHQLIAHILTSFYSTVLAGINDNPPGEYTVPEEHLTAVRFEHSDFLYNNDITPISSEGFEAVHPDPPILHGDGWRTEAGGNISFETECKSLGFAYIEYGTAPEGGCAVMNVYVDDKLFTTIDTYNENLRSDRLLYVNCVLDDSVSHHSIRFEASPEHRNEGIFDLLGLAVSY
ncbi:MAG: SGNH/GDSL hydrolase family protein [Lachnospiraceae bacterium]|nr:SGNH/GDSL hydrolase family protein [Lachnospiraceae bacterium]